MTTVEMKVDALCRMILGTSEEDRAAARSNLCKLMDQPVQKESVEAEIHNILAEIGCPCGLVGHTYLVAFIQETVKNVMFTDRMTDAYVKIAARFGTSASRCERGVRHAIEVAWNRGDLDVLQKYFGNTVSIDKGKPTNTEFIARVANIVRLRLNS